MRITIPKDGKSGNAVITKGDYWVSLHPEVQMIYLSGAGRDIKLPATKRSNKSKYKTLTVIFAAAGGVFWSIMVATPKYGEWVAQIELGAQKDREERRRR